MTDYNLSSDIMKPIPKDTTMLVWKCTNCWHVITDTEYNSVRFDYVCPNCMQQQLSDFIPTHL